MLVVKLRFTPPASWAWSDASGRGGVTKRVLYFIVHVEGWRTAHGRYRWHYRVGSEQHIYRLKSMSSTMSEQNTHSNMYTETHCINKQQKYPPLSRNGCMSNTGETTRVIKFVKHD